MNPVKIIFIESRRGISYKQHLNVNRAKARRQFEPLNPLPDVSFVSRSPAAIANAHANPSLEGPENRTDRE
jgi:hypothetical protein